MGGCGCPSCRKVSLVILAYFAFSSSALGSDYAADAATNLSMWQSVNIAPLRCMGCLSCGFRPRKKFPAARMLASLADKYDASE